jgi:hypothetical protein
MSTKQQNVHLEDRGNDGGDNIMLDRKAVGCDEGKWIEMAQDHIPWRALLLVMLNLSGLLALCLK